MVGAGGWVGAAGVVLSWMFPDDLKMVNNLTIYIIRASLNTELNTLWCSGVFAKTAHLSQLQNNWLESPGLRERL